MTARGGSLAATATIAAALLAGAPGASAAVHQRPAQSGALTITAAPNPNTAGDPVVIFGNAPAGARVVLWHRVNPAPRFTPVSRTTASATGHYEFTRADGVVTTNRNWFIVVNGRRSRIVH
ncbi:MAG: hypothetical protein QOG35_802, partial [Solirubrobacteraceae bacterium]|nr:hypothetical protein [Solirubrobacteraceae bacterium]